MKLETKKAIREYLLFRKKVATIEFAEEHGNVARACRTFSVARSSYYRWKKVYEAEGESGLKKRKLF